MSKTDKIRLISFLISIVVFIGSSFYVFQISTSFQITRVFYLLALSFPLTATLIGFNIFYKTAIHWVFILSFIALVGLIGQSSKILADVQINSSTDLFFDLIIYTNGTTLCLSIVFGIFLAFGDFIEKFTKTVRYIIENPPKEKIEND